MSWGTWIVYATDSEKYPFSVVVEPVGASPNYLPCRLLTTTAWPQSKEVFCLAYTPATKTEQADVTYLREVQRSPILGVRESGYIDAATHQGTVTVHLMLDRPRNKISSFRITEHAYKEASKGHYRRILWGTPQTVRAPHTRPWLRATRRTYPFTVIIDSQEKRPWSFGAGCPIERRRLTFGDYALRSPVDGSMLMVIERKSLADLVRYFSNLEPLHHALFALETYPHRALVIEATYQDCLKPDKVTPYATDYVARVLADVEAFHPTVKILYLPSRHAAQEWVLRYFQAIYTNSHLYEGEKVTRADAASVGTAGARGGAVAPVDGAPLM